MKNLIAGIVIGAIATGAIGYGVYLPKVKEASYSEGMAAGNTAGMAKGIEEGMEKAKAEMLAKQQTAENEKIASLEKELASKEAAARKAAYKPKDPKPLIENWHVEGNEIAEPIPHYSIQEVDN